MGRLLLLAFLFSVEPASAQWLIEESQKTDGLRSRPTATAAGLVSNEGQLAWEYMCLQTLSGRYIETLDLYTEQDGDRFSGGTVRYRFDGGQWQRVRWNSFGGASLGFHSDDNMHRFLGMLRRYRSLELEATINEGRVANIFDLAGTIATLDEIDCPVRGGRTVAPLPAGNMEVSAQTYSGLGTSRSSITNELARLDVVLDYNESPLHTGEQRLLGTMENPFILLELTGRPSNLRSVSLSFSPQASHAANVQPLAATIVLFQAIVPGWKESIGWLSSSMESGEEKVQYFYGNREVTMTNYAKTMGFIILSIKRREGG